MLIHKNFTGGNIRVCELKDDVVYLENELRDTIEPWFYWAFCVEGGNNQTLTFKFKSNVLGYFGPAISYDLKNWKWLDCKCGDDFFTYTFGADENRVYFAHSMLYHPERFEKFVESKGLKAEKLCTGYKGSAVPCLKFGEGKRSVILTARHHACESTGSYVLEGVLTELIEYPATDTRVFCVPFVDYEGVIRGDQGKSRAPHDHNRDYQKNQDSIYPECAAIKEYARINGCYYAFDFHAPNHKGGENDRIFIVRNRLDRLQRYEKFSYLFEKSITENSMKYYAANDYPPETGWNHFGAQFAAYMSGFPENQLSFSLENAYFGTQDNKVSEERLVELGKCFAKALKKYMLIEKRL